MVSRLPSHWTATCSPSVTVSGRTLVPSPLQCSMTLACLQAQCLPGAVHTHHLSQLSSAADAVGGLEVPRTPLSTLQPLLPIPWGTPLASASHLAGSGNSTTHARTGSTPSPGPGSLRPSRGRGASSKRGSQGWGMGGIEKKDQGCTREGGGCPDHALLPRAGAPTFTGARE